MTHTTHLLCGGGTGRLCCDISDSKGDYTAIFRGFTHGGALGLHGARLSCHRGAAQKILMMEPYHSDSMNKGAEGTGWQAGGWRAGGRCIAVLCNFNMLDMHW